MSLIIAPMATIRASLMSILATRSAIDAHWIVFLISMVFLLSFVVIAYELLAYYYSASSDPSANPYVRLVKASCFFIGDAYVALLLALVFFTMK
ncbi:hypothetical protein R6Q59_009476 [Mikania micrantha]